MKVPKRASHPFNLGESQGFILFLQASTCKEQMNKILSFIKNNASLVVMISLCVIPLCMLKFEQEKPSAKKLELSAVVVKTEPGVAEFEMTLKNTDQIPYIYWITHEGAAMPSKLYKAEVIHEGISHQSLNKGWDPLPVRTLPDQIFINAGQNDKLGAGADVAIAPGASIKTMIRLEGLPFGKSAVSFTVDKLATSPVVEVDIPSRSNKSGLVP